MLNLNELFENMNLLQAAYKKTSGDGVTVIEIKVMLETKPEAVERGELIEGELEYANYG